MQTNQGIIGTLVTVIIALLVLSFFGVSLRGVVESPTGQSNFGYVKELTVNLWNNYLAKPARYLYNDVFLDLTWNPFIQALRDIKSGKSNSGGIEAPKVDLSGV